MGILIAIILIREELVMEGIEQEEKTVGKSGYGEA